MPAQRRPPPRLLPVALAASALLLLVTGSALMAAPGRAALGCDADPAFDGEESLLLALLNAYRVEHGAPALAPSLSLARSAQWKADDMAAKGYLAHDDPGGRTWSQRIRDCGYTYPAAIGENLALGYPEAAAVLAAWQGSPGHDGTMLNPEYRAVGIGRAQAAGSAWAWYWALDLGGVIEPGWNDPTPWAAASPTATPTRTATAVATATSTPTVVPSPPSQPPSPSPRRWRYVLPGSAAD